MMTRSLAVVFLIALASTLTAQEPAAKITSGIRLTYELPVDAMQRTLQKRPDSSMEKLLTDAVSAVRRRLKASAKIQRLGAASFTIELGETKAKELAAIRNVIETVGSIEFRIVASDAYQKADLQLAKERDRMTKWLANGGRKKLRLDPTAIATYEPLDAQKVRWVVRRIQQKDGKWDYPLAQLPQTKGATIQVFGDLEWNLGRVPAGHNNQHFLLEVLAINMHERGFTERDLDPKHTRVAPDGMGHLGIMYGIVGNLRAAYADWSAHYIGQASAVIANGELLSAPVFISKITGKGIIQGSFDEDTAKAFAAALRSGALPAKPTLVKQETLPTKTGK